MYKVRLACLEDVDAIWNMGKNVNEFETASEVVYFWPREILKECIDKKDVIMLVAEAENEIVGFIIVNVNLSLKKSEIENIYVLDSFRNQKIGSQLVTEVIKESKKIGVENICFLSSKDHSFWEKNGFLLGEDFKWMDLILTDRFKK